MSTDVITDQPVDVASDAINPDRYWVERNRIGPVRPSADLWGSAALGLVVALKLRAELRPGVLRRVFRLREPTTSHEAFQNLIRAGWWKLGLLRVAAAVSIGLKDLVASPPAWCWPVVFVAVLIPAGAAALTVAGEMAAAISLRLKERKVWPTTGKFLVDNDVLVGVLVVAGLIVLAIVLVMFRAV
jgi:hypothetical protein